MKRSLQEEEYGAESQGQGLFYISSAFGISLFSVASIFYRFTGVSPGHPSSFYHILIPSSLESIFNPNVSLALCLIGAITPARFILCAIAQIVGGIVAA